jgi:hypothetical protein
LAPLIIGALLIIFFFIWEGKFAKWPIFPKRLGQAPSILIWTLVITFISGANFFSIIMFWPTQAFNVYGHDPVGVGLRGLPVGLSIMVGAVIVLVLLSFFRGQNKALMIGSSVMMTAGCGAIAVANQDNLYQLWGILVVAGLGIGGKNRSLPQKLSLYGNKVPNVTYRYCRARIHHDSDHLST